MCIHVHTYIHTHTHILVYTYICVYMYISHYGKGMRLLVLEVMSPEILVALGLTWPLQALRRSKSQHTYNPVPAHQLGSSRLEKCASVQGHKVNVQMFEPRSSESKSKECQCSLKWGRHLLPSHVLTIAY